MFGECVEKNVDEFKSIYDWFLNKLVIIDPDTSFQILEASLGNRDKIRSFSSEFLSDLGTGISSIRGEKIPIESLGLPPSLIESIESDLTEEGQGIFLHGPDGQRISFYMINGSLAASRVVT